MNLPGYSPDFNADEAIWGWAREEATGNLCLGTKELVQERVGNFFDGLAGRKEEVKRRCRTILQSRAEGLPRNPRTDPHHRPYVHPHLGFSLVLQQLWNDGMKRTHLDGEQLCPSVAGRSRQSPLLLISKISFY